MRTGSPRLSRQNAHPDVHHRRVILATVPGRDRSSTSRDRRLRVWYRSSDASTHGIADPYSKRSAISLLIRHTTRSAFYYPDHVGCRGSEWHEIDQLEGPTCSIEAGDQDQCPLAVASRRGRGCRDTSLMKASSMRSWRSGGGSIIRISGTGNRDGSERGGHEGRQYGSILSQSFKEGGSNNEAALPGPKTRVWPSTSSSLVSLPRH